MALTEISIAWMTFNFSLAIIWSVARKEVIEVNHSSVSLKVIQIKSQPIQSSARLKINQ